MSRGEAEQAYIDYVERKACPPSPAMRTRLLQQVDQLCRDNQAAGFTAEPEIQSYFQGILADSHIYAKVYAAVHFDGSRPGTDKLSDLRLITHHLPLSARRLGKQQVRAQQAIPRYFIGDDSSSIESDSAIDDYE